MNDANPVLHTLCPGLRAGQHPHRSGWQPRCPCRRLTLLLNDPAREARHAAVWKWLDEAIEASEQAPLAA